MFGRPEGHPTASRLRKAPQETGSFGKSTRRSRSKTGTPAKREDPTIVAADAIFTNYLAGFASKAPEAPQRKASSSSQTNLLSQSTLAALPSIDGNAGPATRYVYKEPTEVILRGFKTNQQYAALKQYETIAGMICEDYARDPPLEQRRYKSDLRDPATLRRRALTIEEKSKALRFAGGEHWIKVTFESAEAAETAIYSSPQTILGHLVYAEAYRGVPPQTDRAEPAEGHQLTQQRQSPRKTARFGTTQSLGTASGFTQRPEQHRPSNTLPRSHATPALKHVDRNDTTSLSPPGSFVSTETLDTHTLSSATADSGTVIPDTPPKAATQDSAFCKRIPTARRLKLKPAEEALLPQTTFLQRTTSKIPGASLWSGEIIGSQVPRTEDTGEFDYPHASCWWKVMYWLDRAFSFSNGDLVGKDE